MPRGVLQGPGRLAWAVAAAGAIAYICLGFGFEHDNTAEEWLYRTGLTAGFAVPLVFVAGWTVLGLASKRPAAMWWRTSLGTALVLAAFTLSYMTGPLAWTFWRDNGMLTPSWLGWIEVSSPGVGALVWLWICWLWLRVRAADTQRTRAEKDRDTPQ